MDGCHLLTDRFVREKMEVNDWPAGLSSTKWKLPIRRQYFPPKDGSRLLSGRSMPEKMEVTH
jgi:hypothetical protein